MQQHVSTLMEIDSSNYNKIKFFACEIDGKYRILKYDDDKYMLIIPLYGTIIDKINILKNLNIKNYETDEKFAIYTGIINSEIKRMCNNLGIKPVKSLKFMDENVEILMILPRYAKIKGSKNSRRSKEEIKKDILDTISGTGSLNITHIIYKCNLNYEYALKLLSDMIRENILEAEEESNNMKYKLTVDGLNYLNNLKKLVLSV